MSSAAMVLPAFAGLAIQHAAVYGVPVILGDLPHSHGPEQEIVEEGRTGLWCPDEDVDAFAAAILRLAGDPPYRDSLAANIRRVIDEKYNVARMSQGFIDAVHYCMATGVPPRRAAADVARAHGGAAG
jgi:glycosyltransferase involved in cell wall biosynthesis